MNGEQGLVVAGGLGAQEHHGVTAQFLHLTNNSCDIDQELGQWQSLPIMLYSHPYSPAVAQVGSDLVVAGGGGYPFPGGERMVEYYHGSKWFAFKALRSDHTFGMAFMAPRSWFSGCNLTPNYGIHTYFQIKTRRRLRRHKWICQGGHLRIGKTLNGTGMEKLIGIRPGLTVQARR